MDLTLRVNRLETGLVEPADALTRLTEAQARTEARVHEFAAGQRDLTAAQARTEESLRSLAAAQTRSEERLEQLLQWQPGEAGRRTGERYERQVVQSAPNLFAGGHGRSPGAPQIQIALTRLLAAQGPDGYVLDVASNDDVFAADLVWWKDERMAPVEISHVVNDRDVERASRRARVLTRVQALMRSRW